MKMYRVQFIICIENELFLLSVADSITISIFNFCTISVCTMNYEYQLSTNPVDLQDNPIQTKKSKL